MVSSANTVASRQESVVIELIGGDPRSRGAQRGVNSWDVIAPQSPGRLILVSRAENPAPSYLALWRVDIVSRVQHRDNTGVYGSALAI